MGWGRAVEKKQHQYQSIKSIPCSKRTLRDHGPGRLWLLTPKPLCMWILCVHMPECILMYMHVLRVHIGVVCKHICMCVQSLEDSLRGTHQRRPTGAGLAGQWVAGICLPPFLQRWKDKSSCLQGGKGHFTDWACLLPPSPLSANVRCQKNT